MLLKKFSLGAGEGYGERKKARNPKGEASNYKEGNFF